jgi:hypothetical protein
VGAEMNIQTRSFRQHHLRMVRAGQWDTGIERASREDYLDEFLVVDLTVTIHIGLTDHLVNLVVRQLFPCKPCDLCEREPTENNINAYRGWS